MRYVKITSDRFEEVLDHLKQSFFYDEPLNYSVKLCRPGEGNFDLEKQCIATLKDNLSVMALSNDNQIAGVALNGVLREGDVERATEALKHSNDDRFKKIFNLLYEQNIKANLFEELGVTKLFEIRILSVDKNFRGQGVAKELLKESEIVALEDGFSAMKTDATSLFSQKICSNVGFCTALELRYFSYKDEDGSVMFQVQPPHDSLKTMYKLIN